MYTITVTAYDPGDYLHPEQRVELVEETSGKRYELYLRNNATAPAGSGEISLFIPASAIKEIRSDREYCVVTLSHAASSKEAMERQTQLDSRLSSQSVNAGVSPSPARRRKR